jgi:hypothetical protein
MDDDKDEDEDGTKFAEREARAARAKRYLQEDLSDQRGWYGRNASRFKAGARSSAWRCWSPAP